MTNENKKIHYIIIVVLLLVIAFMIWFFVWQKNWSTDLKWDVNNTISQIENNNTNQNNENIIVTTIWDQRCTNCNTNLILDQIKTAPFLSWVTFKEIIDFSSEEAKKIMTDNDIKTLPAFIFNTNKLNDNWEMSPYLMETAGGNYILNVWSEFDPYAEICDNSVDDNGNWLIDCEDPTCWKELQCAPKVDKPVAELFIMSYCPYWLQAQKWYLEAMMKLKDVADMKVKFVHYLMHGKKEWDENIIQGCIQKEQNDKYIPYLQCFLKDDKAEECRKTAWIDENMLQSCITQVETEIDYEAKLADTTKRFPDFGMDMEDSINYWVQWSPSFVLNWILVENVWRDAKSYADLICNSFKEKPEVCNEEFSNTSYDPNFWFTSNWQVVEWWCGG